MMKPIYGCLLSALLPLAISANEPSTATPEEPATAAESEFFDDELLDELIVTASRTEQTLDDVLGSAEVITREEIESSGVNDVADLLRQKAGLDVVRSGPLGSLTSIFMRGTESDHVLVLVDGVRVNSPIFGLPLWANLSLSNIERIEIVRGPRSAQWGADAIGGVIQIFTRSTSQLGVEYTTGSFGVNRLTLTAGYGERYRISASANKTKSDGFSAQNEDGFSYDPDNDGTDQESASVQFITRLPSWYNGGVSYNYTHTIQDIDSTVPTQEDRTSVISGFFLLSAAEVGDIKISRGRTTQYIDDVFAERDSVDLQANAYLLPSTTLSLGMSESEDHGIDDAAAISLTGPPPTDNLPLDLLPIDTSTLLPPNGYDEKLRLKSKFVQLTSQLGAYDIALSRRVDDHSRFGPHETESLAMGVWLGDSFKFYGSSGTGFRAPNLPELFRPGELFAGNPDLRPEKSRNKEVGFQLELGDYSQINVAAYRQHITDLITVPPTGAENIERADIEGGEVAIESWFGNWTVASNFSYTKAINSVTGEPLLRRARRKANLAFGREWNKVTASADINASGKTVDFGGVNLGGYTVFNTNLSYQITESLFLGIRGENLTDKRYTQVVGFNTPSRSGYLTVRWNIDM